jgi:signal transduction histidine kinase
VVKHSHAQHAEVKLAGEDHQLQLDITDDGCGFDLKEAAAEKSSLGLISMRERVRIVNGDILIKSNTNRGTHIEAHVPMP